MISKTFVLAGKAIFTIEVPFSLRINPETKKERPPHYTFLVEYKKADPDRGYPEKYFVKVLTGPNNRTDYTYLGELLPKTGEVIITLNSRFPTTSFRFRLLNRVLNRIWANDHDAYEKAGCTTHHEGRCGKCGAPLTVPLSILDGLGPVCRKTLAKRNRVPAEARANAKPKVARVM